MYRDIKVIWKYVAFNCWGGYETTIKGALFYCRLH